MLLKIIYVLKQACSIWNIDIDKILVRRGYQQSKVDPCLYYRKNFLMAIYIDDWILAAKEEKSAVIELTTEFEITDEGEVDEYLCINI